MEGRCSAQELMAWGIMLNQETPHVSNQAKKLFARAKSALSVGSGHTISGISGNDRALACVCLCLVKLDLPTCNSNLVKASLQRTSGVKAQAFSNGLKELPLILQRGSSINSSPTRKSPTKKKTNQNESQKVVKDFVIDGSRKGKEVTRVIEGSRNLLMKSSPLKRPASMESDSDDELLLTPTRKKRTKISVNIPINKNLSGSKSRTPKPKVFHEPTRTIQKTPLNLPIKKPPKPMCIFQSQPILNLDKDFKPPRLNFCDWNWKSNLFQSNWSLNDIHEWEKWKKKSIESSLS